MFRRLLGYLVAQMENKCSDCTLHVDQCICQDYPYEERVENLVRCERCNTYECYCGDSDFEDAISKLAVEICPDCNWSVKIAGNVKIQCVCKTTLSEY